MSIYEHRADLTAKQPAGGGGMRIQQRFIDCPHTGSTEGAKVRKVGRSRLLLLCAACNKESK